MALPGHDLSLKHRTTVFVTLYGGTYFFRVAFGAAALLLLMILKNLNLELTLMMLGIILFAVSFSLIEGLIAGATGYLTDILDARLVLVLSTLLGAIVMFLYFLGIYIGPLATLLLIYLIIIHGIHGIVSSLNVTPTLTIITRLSTYHSRARHMGLFDTTLMLGRITGLALAGYLFSVFSKGGENAILALRSFLILSSIMILTGFIFWILLPKFPPERKEQSTNLLQSLLKHIGEGARVMFSKPRRDLGLTWLSLASLWGLAFTLGPLVLMLDFGIKEDITGYLTAFLTFVIAIPAPFWGYVADKIGRRKTSIIGICGLIVTAFLGGFSYFVFHITTENPLFFVIVSPGVFFMSALAPSFLGRLGDTALPGERGITMSGFQFITSMGEINGVITGGIAYLLARFLLANTSLAPIGGTIGVALMGLSYFLMTILFSMRLKTDEEVLEWYEKMIRKKETFLKNGT